MKDFIRVPTLTRCAISHVSEPILLNAGKYKREIQVWYKGKQNYLLDQIAADPSDFEPIDTTACYDFECYLNGLPTKWVPQNHLNIYSFSKVSNSNQNFNA